jgi:hypothetical protein
MLIIVVSDIHRQTEVLDKIQAKHPTATLFLDAGDSERHDFEIEPFQSVKGNCDFFIKNKYRYVPVLNHGIYVIHGNNFPLNHDSLATLAKSQSCDIIIHGHTHSPYYVYHNGVHILCPGSPTYPRTKIGATYGLIRLTEDEVEIKIMKVKDDE